MLLPPAIPADVNPAIPAIPMMGAMMRAGAATTATPAPVAIVATASIGFSRAALRSYVTTVLKGPDVLRISRAAYVVLTR